MSKRKHMTKGMLPHLKKCTCGSIPKMDKKKMTQKYSSYQVICPKCGAHTKLCSTAAYAEKNWNMQSGITIPKQITKEA